MMALAYEGLKRQIAEQWLISTPRQNGKSWWLDRFGREYPPERFVVVDPAKPDPAKPDPAKPGSDRTVVFSIFSVPDPSWLEGFYPIVQAPVAIEDGFGLTNPERRASPADLAEPCASVRSETDRIWDLIVLTAESSRYG